MTFLSGPLRKLLPKVKKFFQTEWGISEMRIVVEKALEIDPDVRARPTLQAKSGDHQTMCVEISDNPYPPQIDQLVVDCKNRLLPVKSYVAIPQDDKGVPQPMLKLLNENGVGLILVGPSCKEIQPAMSLSLTGVRDPEPKSFPMRYRQCVTNAYKTFRFGDPAKGVLLIHEEIEDLTRRLCTKAEEKGWWRWIAKPPTAPFTPPAIPPASNPKVSFAKIAKFLQDQFYEGLAKMPGMQKVLDRVVAIVDYRNDGAHKPKTPAALKKRHAELRTRFESGVDLLRDLVKASRGL
jgi:hypothetical protein